ncbi:MAG TPA: DUF2889 domain-containing protein [Mycobacteriales bacterium]|nr:DUF2889 domain-containing protein [Mycobacteriales bacterium]
MLWPGTVGPATSTPPRAPGSVRRTSTVDIRRPDGLLGNIVLEGRARDLVTNRDGTTEILGETRTHLRIDVRSRTVQSVESDGDVYGLVQLVGARAGGGFRKALDDALPDRRDDGSLLMLLLDETPGTTLISGSALARALGDHAKKNLDPSAMVDVCAGWEDGGVMVESTRAGSFTYYGQGPAAPELRAGDDALAWHAVDPLDVWDTRRARRIDVTVDDVIHVEGLFRDSCIIADGTEQVIHEYTVLLEADPDSLVVTRASATPGVLPGPQCPKAADSAHRIVGRSLPEIRRLVRDTFAGPTTCTHLNDELRALGDVHALVKAARERI